MNFEEFIEKMKPLHNHIVMLYDHDMVRLIGVAKDALDYYYIVKPFGHNNKPYWGTAVGHCISLKDVYPRYKYLDESFAMNGCQLTDEFEVKILE